jgi:hypothetical protein
VDVIALACMGDCADIEAVATGGNPPYNFSWEDGSKDPKRHVCLDASATLHVSATDTAINISEFGYAAQTVEADVAANVRQCSDAGPGPGIGTPLCIKNPSFEGNPPGVGFGQAGSLPKDWSVCSATPDVCPFGDPFCSLPASDGSTYLGFGWYNLALESAGGEFCSALQPGQPVSFAVDIAISSMFTGVPTLEFWGGATACAKDELLWRSPPIMNNQWQTYCGTFTPTKSVQYFVILHEPANKLDSPYILMDNFRMQDGSCK